MSKLKWHANSRHRYSLLKNFRENVEKKVFSLKLYQSSQEQKNSIKLAKVEKSFRKDSTKIYHQKS